MNSGARPTIDLHEPTATCLRRAHGRDARATRVPCSTRRSGLILIVVLFMISLLALLAAAYTFTVRSELESVEAVIYDHQARHAAESGLQAALLALRSGQGDPANWYDRPDLFKAVAIQGALDEEGGAKLDEARPEDKKKDYAENVDTESQDSERKERRPTWRFNLVAANHDDPSTVRYGISDECAKLDINLATPESLRRCVVAALGENAAGSITDRIDPDVLVESLLDWRSPGQQPRENGAKDEYYLRRKKPGYRCKCAPFVTVEELLLVRGFTARVLYGEDTNRNGMLDANENDGDIEFPPDDGDGALNRGLLPYFTVWSRDMNMASDRKPRINLNLKDVDALEKQLNEAADLPTAISSFILQQRRGGRAFKDVLELVPVPEEEIDEADPLADLDSNGTLDDAASQPSDGGEAGDAPPADAATNQPAPGKGGAAGGGGDSGATGDGGKDTNSNRRTRTDDQANPRNDGNGQAPSGNSAGAGRPGGAQSSGKQKIGSGRPAKPGTKPPGTPGGSTGKPGGAPVGPPPPGTVDDLPAILNRLTTQPIPLSAGRININTAPKPVLMALTELSEEQVNALVATRAALEPDQKSTPAWLVTEGIISLARLRAILPRITSSSATFAVESVGFADHVETSKRLYMILEMRGPIGQVLYYQDLTGVGPAYHPREEEETRALADR